MYNELFNQMLKKNVKNMNMKIKFTADTTLLKF